jgi:3-oxoacyl-[acyl-carrier protein] reductase
VNRQTYLVTGASRGLGAVITAHLLAQGHRVHGLSRKADGRIPEFEASGPDRFRHLAVDLCDPAALRETVFPEGIGADTPVHGLVNNAAVAVDDLVTNFQHDALEDMFRVNVFASMELSRGFIRHCLLHQVNGSLVHISSICAHTGFKGLSLYAATKGAIEAFSRNVAREWGQRGIRSNCVACGFMETDMSAGLDPDTRERIHRRNALPGPVDPASVATTVAHLLSEAAGSITGQTIRVDNGAP